MNNIVKDRIEFFKEVAKLREDEKTSTYLDYLNSVNEHSDKITMPLKILMGIEKAKSQDEFAVDQTNSIKGVYNLKPDQKNVINSMMTDNLTVMYSGMEVPLTEASAVCTAALNGLSVLVTSNDCASIEAVKDNLPSKVKGLAVMLGTDRWSDHINSVLDRIVTYYNRYSLDDMQQKQAMLENVIETLSENVKKNTELVRHVVNNSENWEDVKRIIENKDFLDLIPQVHLSEHFSASDLEKLYETNCISESEELLFRTDLLESLHSPNELERKLVKMEYDEEELDELVRYFSKFAYDPWMVDAALETETGTYHKLLKLMEKMLDAKKVYLDKFPGKTIDIDETLTYGDLKENFPKIHNAFIKKGRLSKRELINAGTRSCFQGISVNDCDIQDVSDCEAVKQFIVWKATEDIVAELWDEMFTPYGIPKFENTGDRIVYQIMELISLAFDFSKYFDQLKEIYGPGWQYFLCINRYDPRKVEIEKVINSVSDLETLSLDRKNQNRKSEWEILIKSAIEKVEALIPYNELLAKKLLEDLRTENLDGYREHYEDINVLINKKQRLYYKRTVLLERLEACSPGLAKKFVERENKMFTCNEMPAEIKTAFENCKLLTHMNEHGMDHNLIEEKIHKDKQLIVQKREELVFWMIIRNVAEKISESPTIYQDILNFQMTLQRMNAVNEEQSSILINLLCKIQKVIPIWMMPADWVFDFCKPSSFDCMIVNNATEMNILNVGLSAVAKHLLISGTESHIRHTHMEIEEEQMKKLQEMHLADMVNRHLYNSNMSLYDISKICSGKKPVIIDGQYRNNLKEKNVEDYVTDNDIQLTEFEETVYDFLCKNETDICIKGLCLGSYSIPITVIRNNSIVVINCGEYDTEYRDIVTSAGYSVRTITPVDFCFAVLNEKNLLV